MDAINSLIITSLMISICYFIYKDSNKKEQEETNMKKGIKPDETFKLLTDSVPIDKASVFLKKCKKIGMNEIGNWNFDEEVERSDEFKFINNILWVSFHIPTRGPVLLTDFMDNVYPFW